MSWRIEYVGEGVVSNAAGVFARNVAAWTDDESLARGLASDPAWDVKGPALATQAPARADYATPVADYADYEGALEDETFAVAKAGSAEPDHDGGRGKDGKKKGK